MHIDKINQSFMQSSGDPQQNIKNIIQQFETVLSKNQTVTDQNLLAFDDMLYSSQAPSNQVAAIGCQMNFISSLQYGSSEQSHALAVLEAFGNQSNIDSSEHQNAIFNQIARINFDLFNPSSNQDQQIQNAKDDLQNLASIIQQSPELNHDFKSALLNEIGDLQALCNPWDINTFKMALRAINSLYSSTNS